MTRTRNFLALVLLSLGAVLVTLAACTASKEAQSDSVVLAATVPSGFIDETVVTGLSNPTAMAFAPDGRLFVCQQGGALRVLKNGQLLATPFLTVTVSSSGERGLLGVTFDPNFATNRFVYVYYTATTPAVHNRLSRFTANGDVAVAGSETVLLELNNLSSATNHNGGALHFGNDGKLYIAVGENANGAHSQTLSNLLGKMLRLNADGSIPTDNPFFNTATGANRAIWALGLRNPFTFAIQRTTGRMFINDVGQNTWEEINDGFAGSNYGWPTTEGATTNPSFRSPLLSYGHGTGATTGCSITGGTFYNPITAQFPSSFVGKYFFADFCSNWIRVFDPSTGTAAAFATGVSGPVDLRVGSDGALYYLARGAGAVGRIRAAANQAPQITTQPANRTVAVGQAATFSVSATGSQPLSYQWQRNGSNISGATAASYTLASAAATDNGATFRVVVSNTVGSVTSNSATLTVTSNAAPTANITAPPTGTLYTAGSTINYAATASDPEDGALPGSAFTWRVDFHHDTHFHPFVPDTTGAASGSFVIPTSGETASNVWYRIHLTVRDSAGLTFSTFRDINPRVSTLQLRTNPAGLQITLDGQPVTTPADIQSVVGVTRTLGVVSPQTLAGTSYSFSSWSDGGASSHAISTPATNTAYTATFTAGSSGGLTAEYFDNSNFTGTKITRVDPSVNFDFGTGSPDPAIGADTFSARWSGSIIPRFSQTYTFYTTSDDGIRLWIDGNLVINNWTDHAPIENTGTIALFAGRSHLITLELYENGGGATARLSWSSASQAKEIVPASQLRPTAPLAFPVRINFQLAGAPIPASYLADTGDPFGFRGNGLNFGWNVSHTDLTRDRGMNADQLLDTLCHFHGGGVWEVALPNGSYSVLASIGDPGFSSTHTLNVEGVSYWNATVLNANQFLSATKTVTVLDGRLSLNQGSAVDKSTRINYVQVTRL
ncbi:MAG TPA: PQQ-dependent sugar dehydrogenase [Polyangiaceae bacterium]